MNHFGYKLLKTAFLENYEDFKYCPYSTLLSIAGLVPLLWSVVSFCISAFKNIRVFSQVVILDLLLCTLVCIVCAIISNLMNRLAEHVSKRYINRMVRKSWQFADKYALDNPSKLERCKELNPEFAAKWLERYEREKRQDMKIEQIARQVKMEKEQKRLREGTPAR